ncbi:uncharacterized protein Z518_05280 [Rhinocladiella mackenziei CBS 650.93]|uniref:tRNA(Phe) (4-demethylwyosine(37)-C(7)) aminocarboxypropyltransferase n=1 Tax=Rhinocladiella mackenziei CBS 650.93 TaxID=1442369 RepID=A0A0D2FQD8_9EURO|nr:uncharacterized protein Z518_05280 [Rhinocladiella mackenziei CBS 650.93]KIX04412.1 hypothetical protein Z518_05280 [Rhinocladiella mackenziei CBS 650.93]
MESDATRTRPKFERKSRSEKRLANPLVKGIVAFCAKRGIVIATNEEGASSSLAAEASIPAQMSRGTSDFQCETSRSSLQVSLSFSDLPKRYTLYAPLLLLAHNFPTRNPRWRDFYNALSQPERSELFKCIAEEGFAGLGVSRIAVNAPIAAEENGEEVNEPERPEAWAGKYPSIRPDPDVHDKDLTTMTNPTDSDTEVQVPSQKRRQHILRSPSGLVPVYGDWGPQPRQIPSPKGRLLLTDPTTRDFSEAFWTSTTQHRGIMQCWAPLYTMFSRGNVSEKARILGLAPASTSPSAGEKAEIGGRFPGLSPPALDEPIEAVDVIDFYVGIGYFAFCYLACRVRRVWGWDINPWSIEGLRRGCERNGWGCVVVRVDEDGKLVGMGVKELVERVVGVQGDTNVRNGGRMAKGTENVGGARIGAGNESGRGNEERADVIKCVAFLGDNKWADKVMREVRCEFDGQERGLNVRHVNLGLLPTSGGSWENAIRMVTGSYNQGKGGWLHVHENVDIGRIDEMKGNIVQGIERLASREAGREGNQRTHWVVSCVHVEEVKTYAPGVMHCVFDIEIKANG